MSWVELWTPDPDTARDFYTAVFGWRAVEIPMALPSGEVTYTVLCRGETEVAGIMPAGTKPRWVVYAEVPDCDGTVRDVLDRGGAVHTPAMDIPRIGRVAVLTGPAGEEFAVIQMP